MSLIWTVALQELRATWRDRRTLSSTILVPLLVIPLITVGLPFLISSLTAGQRQQMQVVGVVGKLPPTLEAELQRPQNNRTQGVRLLPVTDAQAAIDAGKADAVLVVPEPLPSEAGTRSSEVKLVYKVGNLKAESGAAGKVSQALERYNRQLVARKLTQLGLSTNLLTPVRVKTIDASSAAESSSGALAFIIPLFLLQFILAGATAAATDAAAGERERGTLEALLSTPAPRSALLLGKLLSTTLTALMAACCSVIGLTLSAPIALLLLPKGHLSASQMSATQQAFGGSLQLGAGGLGALLLIVASSALLISALLLMLSLFARTVREAQTLIAPLSLLIVLPATLLQFADFLHASPLLYALPLVGGMLSILDTVKGTLTMPHLLLSLCGNVLLAALLGWLGTRLFGTERLSFKE